MAVSRSAFAMSMAYVSILNRNAQYHTNHNANYSGCVEDDSSFGDRVRTRRVALGLTPSTLAQRVGVTENAIRQMELGYTKCASFAVGLKLAHVLGISPWALAGETPLGEEPTPSLPDDELRVIRERLSRVDMVIHEIPNLVREIAGLNQTVEMLVADRVLIQAERQRLSAQAERASTGRKAK